MKLFEQFFSRKPESEVATLHPDFKLKERGWYFNRSFNVFIDQGVSVKVRFGFDNPSLLDGCQFQAKIGTNSDSALSQKYIGFAYARKQDLTTLTSWAQKFPYAELIDNLDDEGVSTSDSNVTVLTKSNKEER